MKVRLQAGLKASYDTKIAEGRKYPLSAQQSYVARNFQCAKDGRMLLDQQGNPVPLKIENVYFYLEMPLPSPQLTERVVHLQSTLTEKFPAKTDFFTNDPKELHLTLCDYRWQVDLSSPASHPLLCDTKKIQGFLRQVADIISGFGPITVYFEEFALLGDGALIACGYPQDFPRGFPSPSSLDLIRQLYGNTVSQGTTPDIAHISVGRFLRQLSEREHGIIWDEINQFNSIAPGTVTFDQVGILYESRRLLSRTKKLGIINLGGKEIIIDHAETAKVVKSRKSARQRRISALMRQSEFDPQDPRAFYQALSAMFGIDEGDDAIREQKTKAVLQDILNIDNRDILKVICTRLKEYKAWTASGKHRFMPLALVTTNLLAGQPLFDPALLKTLAQGEPGFRYLTESFHWLANPDNIPEDYIPKHHLGPVLERFREDKETFRWLDIGCAPKAKGAPTLNLLARIFPNFEFFGTDISFPLYWAEENNTIHSSMFVDTDGSFLPKVVDRQNRAIYLDAKIPEFDIAHGASFFSEGSLDVISLCMVMHHLAAGSYKRLPFSTQLIYSPDGEKLKSEIELVMTEAQQKVIDCLLGKLAPQGILFVNFSPILFGLRKEVDPAGQTLENNDDMFFLIRRNPASDGFTFFLDDPIPFRPNATPFAPENETNFFAGNKTTFPFLAHPGITSLYPSRGRTFQHKVEALFVRSNKLAFRYQGWKKGVWGRVAAVCEQIRKRSSLVAIFEAYLQNVPDDHLIKIKLLKEAAEIEA